MREIKFKIWDRQAGRWEENDCSLHCCSNWQIDPFTGQLTDFVSALDSDEVTRYNADPAPDYYWKDGKIVNEPRYVLVQYTGLKDKNGVEIYEEDILRFSNSEKIVDDLFDKSIQPAEEHIVKISQNRFGTYFGQNTDSSHYGFLDYEKWEVIGNIFENPELLEK